MLSSSTIYHVKNRSRSGLLYTVFVNSGDQRCAHLAQNHHQLIQESGLKIRHLAFRSILRPFFDRKRREFPDHQACEFTKTVYNNPLLEPCVQATNARFLTFAPISHVSAQKSSNIRAIYQEIRRGAVFPGIEQSNSILQ